MQVLTLQVAWAIAVKEVLVLLVALAETVQLPAAAVDGEVTLKVEAKEAPGAIERLVEVKLPVQLTGTVLVNENVEVPQAVVSLLVTEKVQERVDPALAA